MSTHVHVFNASKEFFSLKVERVLLRIVFAIITLISFWFPKSNFTILSQSYPLAQAAQPRGVFHEENLGKNLS